MRSARGSGREGDWRGGGRRAGPVQTRGAPLAPPHPAPQTPQPTKRPTAPKSPRPPNPLPSRTPPPAQDMKLTNYLLLALAGFQFPWAWWLALAPKG